MRTFRYGAANRDETHVFHTPGRNWVALLFVGMSVFWVVATITLHNNQGLAGAILLLTLWTGWMYWRTGLYAGPSGVRIVRVLGIGIFGFIRTIRVAWSDIDRFEFRPGGSASYFAYLIRASDQRAMQTGVIMYPRNEKSRLFEKLHPKAQAQMDELNTLLQENRQPTASPLC